MEEVLKEVRETTNMGIKIQEENVEMLRYADAIALVAKNEGDLEEELQTVLKESYNIKINHTKTKIMVCRKQRRSYTRIRLEDQVIDEVDEFCYLRSTITTDGKCKRDITSRVQQAKKAFHKMKHLLTSNSIVLHRRLQMTKTYVWSIALYGCETWTIGTRKRRRLEALENGLIE
ncbi:hypothetical protein ILUMI_24740 [Ignelater luminosus]|uniref:Reverse transcriptase domain-containing protein n=1 Tax=Ignelater luminosus TaxID=2038154 RepID=A0A8K0C6M8_IGNLU|nr:hypothetical protein ILUMI_24740 [Ignelater luminosus]